jgi:hypothetical protein
VGDSDRIGCSPGLNENSQKNAPGKDLLDSSRAMRPPQRAVKIRIPVPDAGPAHRHAAQTCRPYVALLCRERLAMKVMAGKGRAQESRRPIGEGDGVR